MGVGIWLAVGLLLVGCGATTTQAPADATARKNTSGQRKSLAPKDSSATARRPAEEKPSSETLPPSTPSKPSRKAAPPDANPPPQETADASERADDPGEGPGARPPRLLGDLLDEPADSAHRFLPKLPRMKVDEARAAAAGIRKLLGKHLTLYTDLPAAAEIDCLPAVFDQALPQWCRYFHVRQADCADWSMTGFLMKDKARFQQSGLLPQGLPPFPNGYSRNHELWLYEQPSDYYRRHLLLHEGTHGFMNTRLGGCGPPWYMEGTAELLATHCWQQGRLTLGVMPASRDEVPEWGRVRIIKDAVEAGRGKRLREVIEFPRAAHLEVSAYAWSWAAATLLDRHPRYQQRFRGLYRHVLERDFTSRFYRLYQNDWQELSEEWDLLVAGMEYGYDLERTAVDFTPGKPLPATGATLSVAADRGWQNSGLRLEGGAKYVLRASGRYQVANQPQIWWCEPGGVSIRYYQGRPLGMLLAAVRPDPEGVPPPRDSLSPLLRPVEVGLGTALVPAQSGTLFLKINDSAAELGDNAGELRVEIKAAEHNGEAASGD